MHTEAASGLFLKTGYQSNSERPMDHKLRGLLPNWCGPSSNGQWTQDSVKLMLLDFFQFFDYSARFSFAFVWSEVLQTNLEFILGVYFTVIKVAIYIFMIPEILVEILLLSTTIL